MLMFYSKIRDFIDNFSFIKRYPALKQLVKFGVVGASNTAIDALAYWLLTRLFSWYYLAAAVPAFIIANLWSYYWNRRWTFRDGRKGIVRQYLKFLFANLLALALNVLVLFILVDLLSLNDIFAKVAASLIVGLENFALNKLWTFGSRREKRSELPF